jgi:hypothetical protein
MVGARYLVSSVAEVVPSGSGLDTELGEGLSLGYRWISNRGNTCRENDDKERDGVENIHFEGS